MAYDGRRRLAASDVNAAFGQWLSYRGVAKVPPIAQTSGVSYTPVENTLDNAFADAFKSFPELVRGARGTYEAYWEQAKKAADDYRAGKSLREIQQDMDNNEVPLQYRPLVMSALEFRQGQESMQVAAQDLTTKINSGEFADLSPMELDEAVTDFMNKSLGKVREAYGVNGGTDAFYNGYYSEVAKVREFSQRRNDELVEQRRKQSIEIQTQAALNEVAQIDGVSAEEISTSIRGLRDSFNLSPQDEMKAYETAIAALASNTNGSAIIDQLRTVQYGDTGQTLEEVFTKEYFDNAQINAANAKFKSSADQMSNSILRWDSMARSGSVGMLKRELESALQRSGNLDTQEVQYIRNYLLQATHNVKVASNNNDKESAQRANLYALFTGTGGNIRKSFSNKDDAIEAVREVTSAMYNDIIFENDPEVRAQKIDNFYAMTTNALNGDYEISQPAVAETFVYLNRFNNLTQGDKDFIRDNPEKIYQVVSRIDPEVDPEGYALTKQKVDAEIQLYQAGKNNPRVTQAILGSSHEFGGQAMLAYAFEGESFTDIGLNMINLQSNYKNNQNSAVIKEVANKVAGGDQFKAGVVEKYIATHYSPEQAVGKVAQQTAKKWVGENFDTINPEGRNLAGTPMYNAPTVPAEYFSRIRTGINEVNDNKDADKQWDMNLIKDSDISDLAGAWIQDKTAALVRSEYERQGKELPKDFGLTHASLNRALNENEWTVKVDYVEPIQDLAVTIFGPNGRPVNYDMIQHVNINEVLRGMDSDDKFFNNTLEVATGKTLEAMKQKAKITDVLEKNKPAGLRQQTERGYISGYEAEKLKGTGVGLRLGEPPVQ